MDKPKPIGYLDIPLSELVLGERIRADYKDLAALERSLEMHGVLDPLIVDERDDGKYNIINGGRRFLCLKKMGVPEVSCRAYETLDDDHRRELELELCIKQRELNYDEEAKAVRELTKKRMAGTLTGTLSTLGATMRKKDIAKELGMSPSTLSQCLTIADALDEHPEIATLCTSKRQALAMISSGKLTKPSESLTRKSFEDSFWVDTPLELVKSIPDRIVDLFILHPDQVDRELAREASKRLKVGGSMVVFLEMANLSEWITVLKSLDLHVHEQPYLWNIKNESAYQAYVWAGSSREDPYRMLSQVLSHPRHLDSMSLKSKNKQITGRIIKSCTEAGNFVVIPECWDIETLKVCYDCRVNVRAACSDRVVRDRLIMYCDR